MGRATPVPTEEAAEEAGSSEMIGDEAPPEAAAAGPASAAEPAPGFGSGVEDAPAEEIVSRGEDTSGTATGSVVTVVSPESEAGVGAPPVAAASDSVAEELTDVEEAAETDHEAALENEDEAAELLEEPAEPVTRRPLVALEPEAFTAEVEAAVSAADDLQVLRLLRREIIAVAEALYRGEPDITAGAWLKVQETGWLAARGEELGLEDLARFHEIVEEVQIRRAEGATEEDLRGLLSDHGFSALLLKLREVFLRSSAG
jgi:hypothetical protein